MAKETLHQNKISEEQVDLVLNDIAMTANVIKRMSVMLAHENDERDIDALTQGIGKLSERIGFLADMTAERRPDSSGPVHGELAEIWMMPPAYHEAAAKDAGG
jgi:hypothetical protein